jgi:hypothetical protein
MSESSVSAHATCRCMSSAEKAVIASKIAKVCFVPLN